MVKKLFAFVCSFTVYRPHAGSARREVQIQQDKALEGAKAAGIQGDKRTQKSKSKIESSK